MFKILTTKTQWWVSVLYTISIMYNIIRPNSGFHWWYWTLSAFNIFEWDRAKSRLLHIIIIIIRTPFKLNSLGFYWNAYRKIPRIYFSLWNEWKQLYLVWGNQWIYFIFKFFLKIYSNDTPHFSLSVTFNIRHWLICFNVIKGNDEMVSHIISSPCTFHKCTSIFSSIDNSQ